MKLMNKLGRMLMVTAVLAGVTAGGLSSTFVWFHQRSYAKLIT